MHSKARHFLATLCLSLFAQLVIAGHGPMPEVDIQELLEIGRAHV